MASSNTGSDVTVTWLIAGIMFLMTSSVNSQGTVNGPISYGTECCTQHLMDSSVSLVAIETTRQLGPATFNAIRLRVCTTDTVIIQVWRQSDTSSNTYQFRWQQQWTPSPSQTALTYVIIPVSPALTTTQQDRLGFYTLSSSNQLSVPFDVNQTSSVYYSSAAISNPASQFSVGQQITLDTSFAWARTFQSYVTFCTAADCSDTPLTSVLSAAIQPSSGQCCVVNPTLQMSCDPSQDAVNQMQQGSNSLKALQDRLDELNKKFGAIFSQNLVTGLCPTGFTVGSFGTGKCYLPFLKMASHALAQVVCRENGAMLLTIDGSFQENFIVNFIQNRTDIYGSVAKIWTSGMYDNGIWYWYPDSTSTESNEVIYQKWLNDVVPVPVLPNKEDICLSININRNLNQDYWTNEKCHDYQFFICETKKKCM